MFMKINNRILKFILIRFDFIIRFIYCKLPFINIIIPKLLFWKLYKSNYTGIAQTFESIHDLLHENNFSLKNKIVMEIGPGNSYLNAYLCLARGASKVILVDKFPRNLRTKKQIDFCKGEIEFFKENNYAGEIRYIDEESCHLNNDYITFIAGELPHLTIKDKVDFIFSITVLQLIKDLEPYISIMSKIIRKDGFMYHQMDLKDKYNNTVESPFLFYKYSDFAWECLLTKEGTSYANRLRYSDYIDLFEKYGFKIIWQQTEKKPVENITINKKFQGRSDLDIGYLKILLKKK